MKTTKIIMILSQLSLVAFTSCKKNYTCTCTTVVGSISGDETHSIDNATYPDAKKSCQNYQDQANNSLPAVPPAICKKYTIYLKKGCQTLAALFLKNSFQ